MSILTYLSRLIHTKPMSPEHKAYVARHVPQFICGPHDGETWIAAPAGMRATVVSMSPHKHDRMPLEHGALYRWNGSDWIFVRYVGPSEDVVALCFGECCGKWV